VALILHWLLQFDEFEFVWLGSLICFFLKVNFFNLKIFFYIFQVILMCWYKINFLKIKNIILIYFQTKNTLKTNSQTPSRKIEKG